MKKLKSIFRDECIIYGLNDNCGDYKVVIPDDEYGNYCRVETRFWDMQIYLSGIYDKARRKHDKNNRSVR